MTTPWETEAAEQSAATEVAVANRTLAEILADPGAVTGAELAAAQAELTSPTSNTGPHEWPTRKPQARPGRTPRRLHGHVGENVAGHNETVRLALEDLAAAVDRALTASGPAKPLAPSTVQLRANLAFPSRLAAPPSQTWISAVALRRSPPRYRDGVAPTVRRRGLRPRQRGPGAPGPQRHPPAVVPKLFGSAAFSMSSGRTGAVSVIGPFLPRDWTTRSATGVETPSRQTTRRLAGR